MSRSNTSDWRRPFFITVGSVLVVELAMIALNMGPETLLVAALGAFVGAVSWCLWSLSSTTKGPLPTPRAFAAPRAAGADHRVKTLRTGILFGRNMHGYADQLRETLIDLIDDQLVHAHGIDRLMQPDDAASVIGPRLTSFVNDPDASASLSNTKELTRIVTLIEQI